MRIRQIGFGVILKALLVLAAVSPWCGLAQLRVQPKSYSGVDEVGNTVTVEAALRAMTEQAGVVFVGTVTSVKRVSGDGFASAAGVVEVQFAVEQSVRGVTGGSYTLREWGGLWSATDQRYKVGSRLLMLLHAPGATGLSSPVCGMDGAIPVKGSGSLVRSTDGTAMSSAPVVDLRWVAAKLARPVVYRKAGAAAVVSAKARTESAAAETSGTGQSVEQARLADSSTPAAQASVATVMTMMSGWVQQGEVGAR